MTLLITFFLFVSLTCVGHARPSRTIPYFPRYYPWDTEDPEATLNQYVYRQQPAENHVKVRRSAFKSKSMKSNVPLYPKAKGGYFPPSLSSLDSVYWWSKRANSDSLSFPDVSSNFANFDNDLQGGMEKWGYTAPQLINMLKVLTKAHRQPGIHVTGKALRFGISR